MNLPHKVQFVFKTIASIIACVFLLQQTAWGAIDTNGTPINSPNNNSGFTPPAALQASQNNTAGAVAVNQEAEEFHKEDSPLIDGSPTYEYDALGRIIKTTYDNGDFIVTNYWGTTTNKHDEQYYAAGWAWQKSIEYYSDGTTMHYQWVADPHPATPGDDAKYEYDTQGRLIQKTLDTGDFIQTFYYGTTTNKQYDVFFASDWTWQKSIVYYSNGITMQYQVFADAHPSTPGDELKYEYDSTGRLIQKTLDTGDFIQAFYWDATPTSNKQYDVFFASELDMAKEHSVLL